MDEMENLRIENELEKQKLARTRVAENRDSGVVDMELQPVGAGTSDSSQLATDNGSLTVGLGNNLKRSTLSNSLLDIHEQRKFGTYKHLR